MTIRCTIFGHTKEGSAETMEIQSGKVLCCARCSKPIKGHEKVPLWLLPVILGVLVVLMPLALVYQWLREWYHGQA